MLNTAQALRHPLYKHAPTSFFTSTAQLHSPPNPLTPQPPTPTPNPNPHPTPTPRAIELDVDALRDTQGNIVICGIMEHIEQAGIHSGDSACSIPTQSIPEETLAVIRKWTHEVAEALGVVGLINIQYAVQVRVVRMRAGGRGRRFGGLGVWGVGGCESGGRVVDGVCCMTKPPATSH